MTFEELAKLARAKEAERRAKLTPEERAEADRRREERRRREEEEYLAKKDETVPLLEHERDIRDLEQLIDLVRYEADERLENLADMALDNLQAQEVELKAARAKLEAARTRIDDLIAANLKAQDMKRQLDRIEKTTVETRQGVGVLVQHLPDAKKPPHIEEAEAVAIMKRKGGDMTDRTLRNWLKAGEAGRVKHPIKWDDLASTASWSAWVDAYLAADNIRLTRKNFLSSRAGKVEAEKKRRRSPTA